MRVEIRGGRFWLLSFLRPSDWLRAYGLPTERTKKKAKNAGILVTHTALSLSLQSTQALSDVYLIPQTPETAAFKTCNYAVTSKFSVLLLSIVVSSSKGRAKQAASWEIHLRPRVFPFKELCRCPFVFSTRASPGSRGYLSISRNLSVEDDAPSGFCKAKGKRRAWMRGLNVVKGNNCLVGQHAFAASKMNPEYSRHLGVQGWSVYFSIKLAGVAALVRLHFLRHRTTWGVGICV